MDRPLVTEFQRTVARSKFLSHAAVRASRLLAGAAHHRLGHNFDLEANGQRHVLKAVGHRVERFVDVGANVGDWTAMMVSLAPSAAGLLVEPGAAAAERCRLRFEAVPNVQVIEVAAGENKGTADFHESPDAGVGSSLVVTAVGAETKQVAVLSLADIVAEHGWRDVSFVKIDAEGYDLSVLRGSKSLLESNSLGVVQFEYDQAWQQHGHSTLAEALSLLNSCGYRCWLMARGGLWEFPANTYREYFHHSDFIATSPRFVPLLEPLILGTA